MLVATIISRLFDPFVLFFILIFSILLRANIVGVDLIVNMAWIVLVVFIPPVILLFRSIQTKKISNWDMSNRKERVRALAVFQLVLIVDIAIIWFMHIPLLTNLFLFFFATFIGFFIITLFWKVSGHLSTATICIGLMCMWYGWVLWPLFLFLPILAWSRVKLKRHTTAQTIGGIVYGGTLVVFGKMLGLI